MVAAISGAASTNQQQNSNLNKTTDDEEPAGATHLLLQNPSRPPLLPSEKDNGLLLKKQQTRRGRQVSSRYMSPSPSTSTSTSTSTTTTTTTTTTTSSSSSSRRCPSPLLSRSTNATCPSTPFPSTGPKRSQSVDRRRTSTTHRPITPVPESKQGNAVEISTATKLLITSTRSLSVSFQGESFSLPISKTKEASTPGLSNGRKATPERRRSTPVRGGGGGDQVENSKPIDQHRWPARTRQVNSSLNTLSRSLDCSIVDRNKLRGIIGSGMVIDERSSSDLGNNPDVNSSDLTASDTDSVSSGSNSGLQDCGGISLNNRSKQPRGINVSARFWQETNSRMRRLQDPGSPLSTSPGSRVSAQSKFIQSKRLSTDSPLSSPRTMASPNRAATRPTSPSKLWSSSSPSRGAASPSRVRVSGNGSLLGNYGTNSSSSTPSILSFAVDIRRGKVGEDRIIDAHMLRLLHNRYLQWRFVNARSDATFMVQRLNAEKNLWNAWVTISELRHSVTLKRIKFLLLRRKLKLASILREQMRYLEEWTVLDSNHSNSLLEATEALKASTLRLPVVGKATADIQNLKDAVGSAVDVMQAMGSSICSLSLKVEEMISIVAELVKVMANERHLLGQCTDFLSILASMQVKDCSLKTHVIQLHRFPTNSGLTAHPYN